MGIDRGTFLRGIGLTTMGAASIMVTAGVSSTDQPGAGTAGEHPNVALIRRYYLAYASGDPNALRPFFAPDIQWRIPGHHPLAGVKSGIDEVLAFFGALAVAGFRAEPMFLAADGDWVVDLHRGWSTSPTGLDILWALAFRVADGRIVEAINFAADQHSADAYFWQNFPLVPLPGRLAPR